MACSASFHDGISARLAVTGSKQAAKPRLSRDVLRRVLGWPQDVAQSKQKLGSSTCDRPVVRWRSSAKHGSTVAFIGFAVYARYHCSRRRKAKIESFALAATALAGDGRETLMRSDGAESLTWQWQQGVTVHYVKAEPEQAGANTAIVLMHGFGVASFHYEAQFSALSDAGYTVYAPDNIGAGLSWPDHDPAPGGPQDLQKTAGAEWGFGSSPRPGYEDLVIGERLWVKQVAAFIEQCVTEKSVFLGGNSLGGYLAVVATALMEEPLAGRIKGLTLINPTPFWGWIPGQSKNPFMHEAFPWKGRLPVPEFIRPLALLWYNALRSPGSIEYLLNLVTSNPTGVGSGLPERIAAMTKHPAGAAAFAQILCTPQSEISFPEALKQVAAREVPVLLLYGREDPWIVPYWASRAVACVPSAYYFQVSPSGHCPHFETPEAVNEALKRWLHHVSDGGERLHADGKVEPLPGSLGAKFAVTESDGREITVTRRGAPEPVRDGQIVWDELPGWLQNAVTSAVS